MASKKFPYEPDYAVPPGATLREALDEKGLSQSDLAQCTGMAEKTISQIVNGIALSPLRQPKSLKWFLEYRRVLE